MAASSEDIPATATATVEDIPAAKPPAGPGTPRLAVENLRIVMSASRRRAEADVVDQVSFTVQPGHVLGLVGESGSGKTTVALALLGLVKRGLAIGGGKVLIDGQDILALSEHELQKLRGKTVAYVPQDPGSALNPVLKVGTQLREVFSIHGGDAERLAQVMAEAGLEDPDPILASYPHQLSGGQQQRVALAMAFACRPRLIVLDEPTTGLDVTTQRRVLETIRELCRSYQVAAVYISHDLAVVAEIADHVAVMYAGRVGEVGPSREVFTTPAHPYTRGLLRAIPSLDGAHVLVGLAGQPPRPGNRPPGCFFQPRCEFAIPDCEKGQPPLVKVSESGHSARCLRAVEVAGLGRAAEAREVRPAGPEAAAPLLDVHNLSATYGPQTVLRDVNFVVGGQQCVAVVGMSGSGKTTLARCLVGLHPTWGGDVFFAEKPLARGIRRRTDQQLRRMQYVSQNPYQSLNPRRTVGQIVEQPLAHFERLSADERYERVVKALTSAALRESFEDLYPDQLSGGERQRVAIARAVVGERHLLLADEPSGALDSVNGEAVMRMVHEACKRGVAAVVVTHDAQLASWADRVVFLRDGRVVDQTAPPAGPETLLAPSQSA